MLTSNGCESEIELLAFAVKKHQKTDGENHGFLHVFFGGMADLCRFLEDMCQICYDGRVVLLAANTIYN